MRMNKGTEKLAWKTLANLQSSILSVEIKKFCTDQIVCTTIKETNKTCEYIILTTDESKKLLYSFSAVSLYRYKNRETLQTLRFAVKIFQSI